MEKGVDSKDKQIWVDSDAHRKLDIVRAKRRLRTFAAVINYLLDFEYQNRKV